jgi:hypothetical protein
MGGGGGKPLNIFRLGSSLSDEPREVLNWRLWFAVFSFGIMVNTPHSLYQIDLYIRTLRIILM